MLKSLGRLVCKIYDWLLIKMIGYKQCYKGIYITINPLYFTVPGIDENGVAKKEVRFEWLD